MGKIGIYGGSFNPVHWGHKGMVKWVLEHTDLEEVWMLVSPKSPHKIDRGEAAQSRKTASLKVESHEEEDQFDLDTNYAERVRAAREEMKDVPHVVVSDFEDKLPRPSYTANTLRELQKTYPEHTFSLIIGEDNWKVFDKWREWEEILRNHRVFVYPRKGKDNPNLSESIGNNQKLSELAGKNLVFLSEAPYFDVSSTEIRKKLQKDLHE